MDNILTHLDRSPVTTGILYDRVMSFADLNLLKDDGYITNSNYQHFIQSWSELYRAGAAGSKFAKYSRNHEYGYDGHRHSKSSGDPIKYGLYRHHQYENELY